MRKYQGPPEKGLSRGVCALPESWLFHLPGEEWASPPAPLRLSFLFWEKNTPGICFGAANRPGFVGYLPANYFPTSPNRSVLFTVLRVTMAEGGSQLPLLLSGRLADWPLTSF